MSFQPLSICSAFPSCLEINECSMSIPFLHFCASPELDDCAMTMNSPVESISPNESIQNFVFLSSTTTSLSDDKNSADLVEKRKHLGGGSSTFINVSIIVEGTQNLGASPTSKKEGDAKEANFSSKEKVMPKKQTSQARPKKQTSQARPKKQTSQARKRKAKMIAIL